jgi:endonuclease III
MDLESKRRGFLRVFRKAEKKYSRSQKRLAAESWNFDWQVLISTILSAQSRDETTIPIAESLFRKYESLEKLAKAKYSDVLGILRSMNYNRTKAKHVIEAAKVVVEEHLGEIPGEIDDLLRIPGVGRKTANLVLSEVHGKPGICVDTHVHRISNVFGFVRTKTADETEMALRELVPEKYWSKINRVFVLWGKDVPGRDKERLLGKLEKVKKVE